MSENEQTRVDLDLSTQVGETSYQVITPGYHATGEQAPDRETHFAGWASSLWQAIEEECRNQAIYLDSGYSSAELLEVMQPLIARAGYKLAQHVIKHREASEFSSAYYGHQTDAIVKDIPDMTAWPEQSE